MALHLHNNQLLSLGQLSFMNLPVLSLLNLASNQIETIHRQAFLNAPQLRFLYLSSNRLTEVGKSLLNLNIFNICVFKSLSILINF
jgi:Leucine-rich repeat (LRR) protein